MSDNKSTLLVLDLRFKSKKSKFINSGLFFKNSLNSSRV